MAPAIAWWPVVLTSSCAPLVKASDWHSEEEVRVNGLLGEHDADFDYYEEFLFKDTDFKALWSPDLNGTEDDETVVARRGYVNLHPSRWFLPFDPETF